MTDFELAEHLNKFFLSVNADIPLLDISNLPSFLPASEPPPVISHVQVCKKLVKINSCKASVPDKLPARILKEFAFELSEPITRVFNASLSEGVTPTVWKRSLITPIAKVQPVLDEGELRPISLTACLSKVL